jgi:hypothetical protein
MGMRHANFPFPNASDRRDATQEIEGAQKTYRTLPSPKDVKDYGLVGLPLIFPMTGQPVTDDYISLHLETAIQELEFNYGLCVKQKITQQAEDMYQNDLLSRFQPFKLRNFPVLMIESIQIMYPTALTDNPYQTYTLPPEWYIFEKTKVNIVATSGTILPSFTGGQGISPLPFTLYGAQSYRPAAWKIVYQCGFENDFIPTLIWNIIIDKATVSLLNDLGPLLFSVNSYSVGIDSINQSAQLPGYKLFEKRLENLEKKIKRNVNSAISYFGCRIQSQFAGR